MTTPSLKVSPRALRRGSHRFGSASPVPYFAVLPPCSSLPRLWGSKGAGCAVGPSRSYGASPAEWRRRERDATSYCWRVALVNASTRSWWLARRFLPLRPMQYSPGSAPHFEQAACSLTAMRGGWSPFGRGPRLGFKVLSRSISTDAALRVRTSRGVTPALAARLAMYASWFGVTALAGARFGSNRALGSRSRCRAFSQSSRRAMS